MEIRINCFQCNAQLVAERTFDRGAEFVASLENFDDSRIAVLTSDRTHERIAYVCSNEECTQHTILRNEDGTLFQM